MYYADKLDSLKDIFGSSDVHLGTNSLKVNGRVYPVIDDVIVLLDPAQYPPSLKRRIEGAGCQNGTVPDFARDIQFTFGQEWQKYPDMLPEHKDEFELYFDIVDIARLRNMRVCDLGCGIGRWSYYLKDRCRELVLVDFSEAIFVARRNMKDSPGTLFFMGDLKRLPFKAGFADFLFCIGVLHHLPTNALTEVRNLKKYAPALLIYLYYSLDNRPASYRLMLACVTAGRMVFSKVKSHSMRQCITFILAVCVYMPFVWIGSLFNLFGWGRYVPLYEGYNGKTLKRILQDVYDRFFTGIEQRVSRKQVMALRDTFKNIVVSENLPYWHFLCTNDRTAL